MSIHWQSFLLGAPVWGSLGIALFAALLAAGRRASGAAVEEDEAERVPTSSAEDDEAPVPVLSLEELRRPRASSPSLLIDEVRVALPRARKTAESALPH